MPDNESRLHDIYEGYNQKRVADIVFVHGLGDTWDRCWWAGDGAVNLRDFFPYWLGKDLDIQGIKTGIWSLEYPASRSEWMGTAMTLKQRAANLLDKISPIVGERPVIFIVHSLGGLVVKQMLRTAQEDGAADTAWGRLLDSVRGIFFLSTPHSGSSLADWYSFFKIVRPSGAMKSLMEGTGEQSNLNRWFKQFYQARNPGPDSPKPLHIAVYYETIKTKFRTGLFGLSIAEATIVNATSADIGIQNTLFVPLGKDHLAICKPASRDDQVYESALKFARESLANPS